MSRSARVFIRNFQGRAAHNLNLPGFKITPKSAVLATAGLWEPGDGFFDPNVRLRVHGPDVFVTTVVPHGSDDEAEGVEFMLHADSPTPVNVAVTITVFEEFETHALIE
ncbi:hypothetical protein ACFP3U_31810 [Kitasatospora misakiensis]|uniref:Uncharacterized protein n=1 Tax=Kitasatospora misakiensis TaxID=67330 RepID=A0ABW0XEK6_9ACTN